MLFPDVAPSRSSIFRAVAEALQDEHTSIYVDTSVLLHCYEISVGAANELLTELKGFAPRLHIPLWVAQETWRGGPGHRQQTPLKSSSSVVGNNIDAYIQNAVRFADETIGNGGNAIPRQEFVDQIKGAAKELKRLMNLVADQKQTPAETATGLSELLRDHVIRSPLKDIYTRVRAEGAFRHDHHIPPGFGDSRKQKNGEGASQGVGNRYGDLIAWFEILLHARANNRKRIVMITRDVKKEDWVHTPPKVLDDHGRPQENRSITLPLPLLVHEARTECPGLNELHIISLHQFVQVLSGNLNRKLPRLTAALQDSFEPIQTPVVATKAQPHVAVTPLTFTSSDLAYSPDSSHETDKLALLLWTNDWQLQSEAFRRLDLNALSEADRQQQIFFGRSLAYAASNQSVGAESVLASLLGELTGPLSQHLFLGVLAEIYLDEEARLKKPVASIGLAKLVYDLARKPELEEASKKVFERMNTQRTMYLALPDEGETPIRMQLGGRPIKGQGIELESVQAGNVELLEGQAATSRLIDRSGAARTVAGSELIEIIATEFVVPTGRLQATFAGESRYLIPPRTGFVTWGPGTGLNLRSMG